VYRRTMHSKHSSGGSDSFIALSLESHQHLRSINVWWRFGYCFNVLIRDRFSAASTSSAAHRKHGNIHGGTLPDFGPVTLFRYPGTTTGAPLRR
jgi:hypothetical protein